MSVRGLQYPQPAKSPDPAPSSCYLFHRRGFVLISSRLIFVWMMAYGRHLLVSLCGSVPGICDCHAASQQVSLRRQLPLTSLEHSLEWIKCLTFSQVIVLISSDSSQSLFSFLSCSVSCHISQRDGNMPMRLQMHTCSVYITGARRKLTITELKDRPSEDILVLGFLEYYCFLQGPLPSMRWNEKKSALAQQMLWRCMCVCI